MKSKTFDELLMRAMEISTSILERSSSIAYYEGLRSLSPGKKISKSEEQKEVEDRQRKNMVELEEIKKYFAEQLGCPELSGMETWDIIHFIFANYRIIRNKPIMRFEKNVPVQEVTKKMIKKGANEFERRRRTRLRKELLKK